MASKATQQKVKAAAIDLFNQFGSGKVSTNRIASHCGISKGNLHYHFKNKQELIRSIFADMAREIETGWRGDESQPSVTHMAEMFTRQLDLIWRFRFFYREMVSLARLDPVLKRSIADFRGRRMQAVMRFFESLIEAGVLAKPRSKESLRYLVLMTWIFCDNWLNFLELQNEEESGEIVQLGYDFIIEILYPRLTAKAREEIYSSYAAVNRAISV